MNCDEFLVLYLGWPRIKNNWRIDWEFGRQNNMKLFFRIFLCRFMTNDANHLVAQHATCYRWYATILYCWLVQTLVGMWLTIMVVPQHSMGVNGINPRAEWVRRTIGDFPEAWKLCMGWIPVLLGEVTILIVKHYDRPSFFLRFQMIQARMFNRSADFHGLD